MIFRSDPELERRKREAGERWKREEEQRQQREQRKREFKREAEYVTSIRKLELEVEERAARLASLQAGPAQKILITELELAEKEAELQLGRNGASMSPEEHEAFSDRLEALRNQITEEKHKG